MESKLPKPSGLKRPLNVPKQMLPMNRIKTTIDFSSSTTTLHSILPLTSNLANIREGVVKRDVRAVSPDIIRANSVRVQARSKLRRSRSACDVRQMRQMVPFHPIKVEKYGMNANITTNINRLPRMGANTHLTNLSLQNASSTLLKKPSTQGISSRPNAARNATASVSNAIKKPASTQNTTSIVKTATATATTTKTSSTGGGKPINKRIPPYDYKARFLDLQEKHKLLKDKYEGTTERMAYLDNLPEQLEQSQLQLKKVEEQSKCYEEENKTLKTEVDIQHIKIKALTSSLTDTQIELNQLKRQHEQLSKEHTSQNEEVVKLRREVADYSQQLSTSSTELTYCREQLFSSNMERKELHNAVMDLRGNIRVFCRIRPPLELELGRLLCSWNYVDEATLELQSNEAGKNKNGAYTFNFDQVFHPNCTQEDIFEMVSPLIQSALDGYNVCIFAYGQTGSGKTYTMDGIQTNPGVIPRTVDLIFDAIKHYKRLGWNYEIKATFVEIYNEVLYDLLSNEQKDLEIRMVKNRSNEIYVSNITEIVVNSTDHLRQLMQIAKDNRATASTVSNERSSRSHAVTRLELIGHHEEKNEISTGTINLVDLAGSESPKTSIRMNETKNINRSLSELANVILALLQKQDFIPYRNSKLTHLLMPSLGGNSKTLMFVNVAPFQDCYGESVRSLRFAASVNSCKMVKAKRNRVLNATQLNNSNIQ